MTTKTCISCELTKDKGDFDKDRNQCKVCCYRVKKNRINSKPISYLSTLLASAKNHSKLRVKNGKLVAGECSLVLEDLNDLYKEQDGKCYYTKLPLVLRQLSDWSCSLERKDPSRGYVHGNVALIVTEFQGACQWTPEKYDEFVRLVNMEHDRQVIEWCPPKDERRTRQKLIRSDTECRCNKCGETKNLDQFFGVSYNKCKECYVKYRANFNSTPHGHMQRLFTSMKSSSNRRNNKCNRNHSPPELTVDDLIKLFESQGGLCAYSGIPMTFGSYREKWWTCSTERKDVNKGYTKENVCLTCFEFNTMDHTSRAGDINDVKGSPAWTVEKMQFIKQHIQTMMVR